MSIDLLNLKKTTISKSIEDKFILLYGLEKAGKTSFAAQAPEVLLLATEVGYNGLADLSAVDIKKWSDFKVALKQLERQEVKDLYKTVAIDTVAILYSLCTKYICQREGVDNIGDLAWGKGYAMVFEEFSESLRKVTQMGYGLIMLAHADIKNLKVGEGDNVTYIEQVSPKMDKRPLDIVNQMVDIIGYIEMEFKNPEDPEECTRTLITRRSANIVAGSRFKYLPSRIPFGYQQLVDAITKAIEMEEKSGATVTQLPQERGSMIVERSFEEVQEEGRKLWTQLIEIDENNAARAMSIVERVLGERKKLSEITEKQKDLFELVIIELKALL